MITSLHICAESAAERILKIGQQSAKLWTRVGCSVFFTQGVYKSVGESYW